MTNLKRTVMTLYSSALDIHSHRVRIVLAEKGVNVDVIDVDQYVPTEDLMEINPYGTVPTLVDRDLVLYQPNVIMEYLDERFPHPPLLPVYPVSRAKCRLMIFRIEQDWYTLLDTIENAGKEANAKATAEVDAARTQLRENLVSLERVFADMPFFLSDEFTLVDCALAPLLWRFPALGIELPKSAKAVANYGERMFEREPFQASLTEAERELREASDF